MSPEPSLVVVPATAERWDDVSAVLGRSACWCAYWRMTADEYGRVPSEQLGAAVAERRARMAERLRDTPAPGMLALENGEPVGWCGIGPRAEFRRLVRSRTIPLVDDVPVWSVVCFLVLPGHRGRGVAGALLHGAVDHAGECGAPAIEGYPVDAGGRRLETAGAYVGTTSMFEAAGFRRVCETSARSAGRPRWVMRRELA